MADAEARLMTVFSAALDCASAAELDAYLDRACADNPVLRERVEALLRAHGRVGDFLGQAPDPAQTAALEPGTTNTSAAVVRGLRPGGVLLLEAYTPEQIGRGTGGPKDPDMLPTLAELTEELAGLEFVHAREVEREVREGAYHTGLASVVQIIGLRPPPATLSLAVGSVGR